MKDKLALAGLIAGSVLTIALAVTLVVYRAGYCANEDCKPLDLPAGVPQK